MHFLKYGFPRIPLPRDIEHFRKLSALGGELIDWHLLKASQSQIAPTARCHRFEGEGEGVVSQDSLCGWRRLDQSDPAFHRCAGRRMEL